MRSKLRIFPSMLVAAALAAPLATGCHHRGPAANDASYRQWEQETHREHRDLNQRTAQEKEQYNDWRSVHERH